MGLLNLALAQLLGIFAPIAGLLVALYFYDRSRRRVLVSTLRFWPKRPAPATRQRHKRIQHPLSLILQLIALGLLLLAIADPRPGTSDASAQRRVIVLDTSASMALADGNGVNLMDQAKTLALAYIGSLPAGDQVMLIEADGSPMVRVPFTRDRQLLRESVSTAEPSLTPLDIGAAFDLADGTLRLALNSGGEPLEDNAGAGETVYVGPGRFDGEPARAGALPSVRYLQTEAPSDSLGILALEASADLAERGKWDVALDARNYGSEPTAARIDFFFSDRFLGHRSLSIAAGGDASLQFTLRSDHPGRLRAQLAADDAYPQNNFATVAIPAPDRTRVQIHGASEREFGPLLAAGARIEASYVEFPEDLTPDAIHVWAGGGGTGSSSRAIYLAPPGTQSPIAEAASARRSPVSEWSASHQLAKGIRDPDLIPDRVRVFTPRPGDDVIASTADGPVIVARSDDDKRLVALGFDLTDPSVRDRLSAPMLFANAVSWLDSAAFRAEAVAARGPGAVTIEAPNSAPHQISVRTASGGKVPWVLSDGKVSFYADQRDTYRVTTADHDLTLVLQQPQIPNTGWEPPESVLRGVPSRLAGMGESWIPWPWLAALGALVLLYDWIRFGRGRRLTAETIQAASENAQEGRL